MNSEVLVSDNGRWIGPYKADQISHWVACGLLAPDHPCFQNDQVTVAGNVKTTSDELLDAVLVIGALVASAVVVVKVVNWLIEDPEQAAIRNSAEGHRDRGAVTFADLKGWPRPPILGGHIPDVYAVYPKGKIVAEEFENERSIMRTHAMSQHRAFSSWALRGSQRRYTQIEIDGGRGGH